MVRSAELGNHKAAAAAAVVANNSIQMVGQSWTTGQPARVKSIYRKINEMPVPAVPIGA
jgi:hypothetical protein